MFVTGQVKPGGWPGWNFRSGNGTLATHLFLDVLFCPNLLNRQPAASVLAGGFGHKTMDAKSPASPSGASSQNLQDTFLNHVRRERSLVAIYLVSGVKLTGRIRGFDKYSVVLEAGQQEQLIFKHAISTISVMRSGPGRHPASSGASAPGTTAESSSGEKEAGNGGDAP
jgi:host factor-I protein